MKIDEMKIKIKSILEGDLSFFAIEKSANSFVSKTVKVNIDAIPSIKEAYQKKANDFFDKEELTLSLLSNYDERNNVIYEYDLSRNIDIFNHDFRVKINSPTFNITKRENLIGFVAEFKKDKDSIILFTKYSPLTFFGRARYFYIFKSEEEMKKTEEEFLELKGNFEFFKLGESWYIKDLNVLEKYFQYHEILKKEAETCLKKISDTNLIKDTSKLLEVAIKSPTFARKILKVGKFSNVLQQPREKILSFINNNKTFKDKFKFDENQKICISTKKEANLLIKLLNDDILKSELTEIEYDVKAKDIIEEGSSE